MIIWLTKLNFHKIIFCFTKGKITVSLCLVMNDLKGLCWTNFAWNHIRFQKYWYNTRHVWRNKSLPWTLHWQWVSLRSTLLHLVFHKEVFWAPCLHCIHIRFSQLSQIVVNLHSLLLNKESPTGSTLSMHFAITREGSPLVNASSNDRGGGGGFRDKVKKLWACTNGFVWSWKEEWKDS